MEFVNRVKYYSWGYLSYKYLKYKRCRANDQLINFYKISTYSDDSNFGLLRSRFSLLVFCISLSLLVSCAPSEDQLLFEQQAFSVPSGFTQTNERGIVQRNDPDDWRIAPMFYRLITVNPIYPNPTSGNDLRLQVYIERTEGLFGLEIVRVDPRGYPLRYIPLYRNASSPLPPGLLNVNIPFQVMFPQYPSLDERGLHRIILLDNRQNVVSYGDVMLE